MYGGDIKEHTSIFEASFVDVRQQDGQRSAASSNAAATCVDW